MKNNSLTTVEINQGARMMLPFQISFEGAIIGFQALYLVDFSVAGLLKDITNPIRNYHLFICWQLDFRTRFRGRKGY